MNVVFKCPHCRAAASATLETVPDQLECPVCRGTLRVTAQAEQAGRLQRCLTCPSVELFVRKDFPQRLGVTIVAIGFVLSSIAWYYHWVILTFAILFATALIDVVLYLLMGDVVECYQCHSQYRNLGNAAAYAPFDLEVHERHRQQQARLQQNRAPLA